MFDTKNKLILDSVSEGIIILNAESIVVFANLAAAGMMDLDADNIVGENLHSILHPAKPVRSCNHNICNLYKCLNNIKVYHVGKDKFWNAKGVTFPVDYRITPISENGNLQYSVITFTNITREQQVKKTEGALRENLEQLSKKNRYETIISTVTRSVHQSINLEEVLENAIHAMRTNIALVDNVVIYLVEEKIAVLRAHSGFTEQFIKKAGRVAYPKGAVWKTLIEGEYVYCSDVDQDSVIGAAGREMGLMSYLSVPIRFENSVIGALFISSYSKHAFNEDEIKLLKVVAQQIEIAINNARHAEELQKALDEVERLKNRLEAENVYLQEEIKGNFEEIVGQSMEIQKVLNKIEQIAPTDITILIQGETGTGKELIARAIHNLSLRKDRTLVKVNCSAISAGLVESELFGHEKGAFTGAIEKRIGRFELADKGTIFLDEVSELPPETQVKILRVIQEGEFERVGSSKPIKVDVRVIAASNRNLIEAVKNGYFRSDLFYRLNVFPLDVPPLRERKSDIPLLVNFFLSRFAMKLGKRIHGVSKDTMELMIENSWPGNVRELQNVVERAIVLSQESILDIDESIMQPANAAFEVALPISKSRRLQEVERSHIIRVLNNAGWKIEGEYGAASILDIHPSTLRYQMKKLGIQRPKG